LEDIDNTKFHELCIYYLIDISNTSLVNTPDVFTTRKYKHNEVFYWLDIDTLSDQYLYPLFIKEKINSLPENFEIITSKEY
jgi:hypothetical protein